MPESLKDTATRIAAEMGVAADAPLTDEQAAEFRGRFDAAMRGRYELRVLPPDQLTPAEVRSLLRECVTVVGPGETLVLRTNSHTPQQMREIQKMANEMHRDFGWPRVMVVPGDELGVVQEPAGTGDG